MAVLTEPGSYLRRRGEIEHYFDRTAVEAWRKLTSDAPVSGIRATVRAGRDAMRETLLSWLPADLSDLRVLDAGCGTGAAAVIAARRGAEVVAVDLSPSLIEMAWERLPEDLQGGRMTFVSGDMLNVELGEFDYAIAMDSLIHYEISDMVSAIERLAPRVRHSLVFTIAPWTPLLAVMHVVGRLLPHGDRAPDICPVRAHELLRQLEAKLPDWEMMEMRRVSTGFYKSQAIRMSRR
jgi:magnesium-protoporphyrin O-methyltransferase